MNRFLNLVVLSGLLLMVGVSLDGTTSTARAAAEEKDKKSSSNIATLQNVTSLGQKKEESVTQNAKYASMTNEEFEEEFFTPDLSEVSKLLISVSLSEVKPEDRDDLIRHAQPLFTPDMDGDSKASIVRSLSRVKPKDRDDLIRHVQPLFTPDMDGYAKANLISSLAEKKDKQSSPSIDTGHVSPDPLLLASASNEGVDDTAGRNPPSSGKENNEKLAQKVPNPGQEKDEKLKKDREFGKFFKQFLTRGNVLGSYVYAMDESYVYARGEYDKSRFQEALSSVNPEDCSAFLDQAQSLFTWDMDVDDKLWIIEFLSSVKPEDRSAFLDQAQSLFTRNMTKSDRFWIIKVLSQLNQLGKSAALMGVLTPDMDGYDKHQIISSLSFLHSVQEIAWLIVNLQILFTPDMNGYDKHQIISSLAQVGAARDSFIESVQILFTPDMTGTVKRNIISSLSKLSFKSVDLIRDLQILFTPNMTGTIRSDIISYFNNVEPEYRILFARFCIANQVRNPYHIWGLSKSRRPSDWQDTLDGMRARDQFAGQPRVVGLGNQTVHDPAFETSIKESVQRLGKLYPPVSNTTLEGIVKQITIRMESLQKQKLLTLVEAKVVGVFLSGAQVLNPDERVNITRYLDLALRALNDEAEAKKALGYEPKPKDMDERFASWLRSGPIDAQLAYIKDSIGSGTFKTQRDLDEALEKNFENIVGKGKSCLGGSYNRLISSLEGMHPAVVIKYGSGALANTELYALRNALQKQGRVLLEKTKDQAMSDDQRRKAVTEQLQKFMGETSQKEYPHLRKDQIESMLKAYMSQDFEKELLSQKGLGKVQNYVEGDAMRKDILSFIAQQTNPFASDLLQKAKDEATVKIEVQLKALQNTSKEDRLGLIDEALAYVPGVISQHQKTILEAIAKRKIADAQKTIVELSEKDKKEEGYEAKVSRKEAVVNYLKDEILKSLNAQKFLTTENKDKVTTMIVEDVLGGDTISTLIDTKKLLTSQELEGQKKKAENSISPVPLSPSTRLTPKQLAGSAAIPQ